MCFMCFYPTGCEVKGTIKGYSRVKDVGKRVYACADENDGFYPSDAGILSKSSDGKDLVFHVAFKSLEEGRQFLRELKCISPVLRITCVRVVDDLSPSKYCAKSAIFADENSVQQATLGKDCCMGSCGISP